MNSKNDIGVELRVQDPRTRFANPKTFEISLCEVEQYGERLTKDTVIAALHDASMPKTVTGDSPCLKTCVWERVPRSGRRRITVDLPEA